MPASDDAMPFLRHVRAVNAFDPAASVPFMVAGVEVGHIKQAFLPLLPACKFLRIEQDCVVLTAGSDRAARTTALAEIVHGLARQGRFGLRGEAFRVWSGWDGEVLATIDRGACAFFGTPAFGIHVNGLVTRGNGLHMWVARRADNRPTFPGRLDNMVGGGLPDGLTPFETMIKESGEEAGLDPSVTSRARCAGLVSCLHDTEEGVKDDTNFVYDLGMAEDLVPAGRDGEVAEFRLLPVDEVIRLVRDTDEFTPNATLVIIDFLIRHGYISPEMSGYCELAGGLRARRPAGSLQPFGQVRVCDGTRVPMSGAGEAN